jgi:hypothetical protein
MGGGEREGGHASEVYIVLIKASSGDKVTIRVKLFPFNMFTIYSWDDCTRA